MVEDFSEHPRSIAEIKSDRSQNGADWTPRDLLISILREIDSGSLDPQAMIVTARSVKDGAVDHQWWAASSDIHLSLGMLTRTIHRIQVAGEGR